MFERAHDSTTSTSRQRIPAIYTCAEHHVMPCCRLLLHLFTLRYQGARDRLMSCRHPAEVAKLEKQLAAEWAWLQDVRRSTTAAVSQCRKQGILRRKAAEADTMCEAGWVVDGMPMEPATRQQCRTGANAGARSGRVKFCLPESADGAA